MLTSPGMSSSVRALKTPVRMGRTSTAVALGEAAILELQPRVGPLLQRLGFEPQVSEFLIQYFVALGHFEHRCPIMVTITEDDELAAVVFAGQRRILGRRIGVVHLGACSEHDFYFGPPEKRDLFLALTVQKLLSLRWAHSVDFTTDADQTEQVVHSLSSLPGIRCRRKPRTDRSTLWVGNSYEILLAGLGAGTRHNMRYYRRKAMGSNWRFASNLSLTEANAALKHLVRYQRTSVHSWGDLRQLPAIMTTSGRPLLCGLYDASGQPLSVVKIGR